MNFLSDIDHSIALWFHDHLTRASSGILLLMSDPASPVWVGSVTALIAFLFLWKRSWRHLAALGLSIPGGMLVNEIMKNAICRARPFQSSPYLDLGGYSFPSGHTMAATLLYGILAVFLISIVKKRRFKFAVSIAACWLIVVVAFSRIALGAHYLTDVLAAVATSIAWLYFSLNVAWKIIPKPALIPVKRDETLDD